MSEVKLIAVEPHDGRNPGDKFSATDRQAAQLIGKGLAKMDGPISNKMAAPVANKSNPSPAAGRTQKSSASRAAPVSRKTTAKKSTAGAKRGSKTGA